MVPIWWDFVKKIGTDTTHTLVVRVGRIGLRVICGVVRVLGSTTADPT
jgi:hypothetical protein